MDMHGNLWEWCEDRYGELGKGAATDPKGPASGEGRVLKGGSWNIGRQLTRSAVRFWNSPNNSVNNVIGFRVVLR
jgi:formylglycine-generating enzyme required for sulfatase activity